MAQLGFSGGSLESQNYHAGHPMLHNIVSRPEIGLPDRTSARFESGKHKNRTSGRPSAGRRADFEAFPIRIRPKSGLEDRLPARKQYRIT